MTEQSYERATIKRSLWFSNGEGKLRLPRPSASLPTRVIVLTQLPLISTSSTSSLIVRNIEKLGLTLRDIAEKIDERSRVKVLLVRSKVRLRWGVYR